MSAPAWIAEALTEVGADGVPDASAWCAPARFAELHPEAWLPLARACDRRGARLSAWWAEESAAPAGAGFEAHALYAGEGGMLLAATRVGETQALASLAGVCAPAGRMERHARDLLGVVLADAPDPRRWTRHAAWSAEEYPLRGPFPLDGAAASVAGADLAYPFLRARGAGVHQIPVGPIHAGIIEPGHFRFQAAGERILNLEARLGYVHKGIEKIACGRDPDSLVRLAARVSGDTAVGHAWAACRALEQAAGCPPSARACVLRALLVERERLINHLGDIGAVCNDVGFAFAHYQFGRLVEQCRRLNARLFGHRLLMDTLVPGGVAVDLDRAGAEALRAQGRALRVELPELWGILQGSAALHDRLDGTGVLAREEAERLGVLGFVARASALVRDLRLDFPYAPYDRHPPAAVGHRAGDVAARVRVRYEEALQALELTDALLADLPDGPLAAPFRVPPGGARGLGCVEAWRGEIVTYVRLGADATVARFFPRDPSWLNWPALERLVRGSIVPDFPVCNKSVNASYAGHDL